jgi:hypothetical protein
LTYSSAIAIRITLARYLNGHGNFVLVVQAFKQP